MRPLLRACAKRLCTPSPARYLVHCTTRFRSDNTSSTAGAGPEAPPFHGYLLDALDAPLHSIAPATKTAPAPPPPDDPPSTPEEEKIAKARVVFGSRLAGPAERKREIESLSTMVEGVMVPPKPEEPDNCCMSGCVNCVWDLYRNEMEEWAEAKGRAREAGKAREKAARQEGVGAASLVKDGGGREADWAAGVTGAAGAGEDGGDLFEGIPVGIREFMRTEKKLKERKGREGDRSAAG